MEFLSTVDIFWKRFSSKLVINQLINWIFLQMEKYIFGLNWQIRSKSALVLKKKHYRRDKMISEIKRK